MEWYEPDEDTYTLIDALSAEEITGRVIVDLGCSTGAITNVLERRNFVISCDLNARALCEMQRVYASSGKIAGNLVHSDLLGGIRQNAVDIVVFNPPYVPDFDCPILGGGVNGREVIDRFIEALSVPLLYLLIIEANKPLEVLTNLRDKGYSTSILKIRKVVGETIIIIKAVKCAGSI